MKNHTVLKIVLILVAAILVGGLLGVTVTGISKMTGAINQYKDTAEDLQDQLEDILEKNSPDNVIPKEKTEEKSEEKVKETYPDTAKTETSGTAKFNDVSDIVDEVMPAVISISATSEVTVNSWFGESMVYETPSSGSGILIDENDTEYMIVTNNHVIENTKSITVTFADEKSVPGVVKGRDSETDIAIVAVKKSDVEESTRNTVKIITVGDSTKVKPGQGVIAIGNALGYGQSVTVGYVSAVNREVEIEEGTSKHLIQTDAAINPGNSGGALINMQGELIGINEAKISSTAVEGVGYAIPVDTVAEVISKLTQLETKEKVDESNRGYLGCQCLTVTSEAANYYNMPIGVFINQAPEDSALSANDIITKLEGQSVKTVEELLEILDYYSAGETVTVTVQRPAGGEYNEMEIEVTLIEKPTEE